MSVNVRFKIGQKKGITANYNVSNEEPIKTIFRINAPSAAFSSITGSPYDNANLKAALDAKADKSELDADVEIINQTITENYNTLDSKIDDVNSDLSGDISTLETSIQNEATTRAENDTLLQEDINTLSNDLTAEINNRATADTILQGNINNIQNTINNYGDIVSYDASDFATYAQGQKADSALQPNDNISELVNDVGYITSASLPTVNNSSIVFQKNGTGFDTITLNQANNDTINITVPTQTSELTNNSGFITASALDGYATENFVTSQGYITGINESDVLDALGYTPYNASNPDGFITGITSNDVITALGYTPYNSTNPSGYQANVIESIKVNNTTQTVVNKMVNITVPTTAAEVGALPDTTTINDLTTAAQQAALNSGATTTNIGQIATNTSNISSLSNTVTSNYNTLDGRITSEVNTLNGSITTEATNRQNADNALQTQIDAITSASDVFDIVGTYAELQAYDISTVPVNDIIKVLVDSTHNNAATYYRCVENNNVKSWSYIGAEGAYYTKSEADNKFVEQTITVNGQPLSSNVTLTASDVGALPSSTTIGAGVLTIQKNGSNVDTFSANATSNKTINITVPTDTNDLTNGAGFITSNALTGYATETWVSNQGYLTAITSSDITTALGYTPYNSTNPDGYITASDLPTNYVTTDTAQDISGRKTFIGEKAIYFKQSAAADKLGFTLYNASSAELGAMEWRPNTINGNALFNLNCSQSGSNYVGFRYWSGINIVAPRPTTNGNYFIPTHITNGTLTVTSDNKGTVNISTLLPDVSNYVTNTSLATTLADYVLSSSLATVATSGSYNDLSDKPTIPTVPTNISAFTNDAGYITGINSSDVTTALGYTPYNSTNPDGFITSSALAPYALSSSLATVATSGDYDDLSNKPTIPTVNDATITFTQGGTTKGTITLNQSSDATIALDAGGSGTTIPNPAYGTSSTAAATAQKEVSIPEITALNVGQVIMIRPSTTSTVANSTIKLNNFDAHPMRYNNAAITTSTDSTVWGANFISSFMFDGTYWQFIGHGIDSNTTYSNMSVSEGTTGTATSARTMRADYLKQIIQGTKLTGLSTADNSAVVATDSILQGIGKLQAEVNNTIPADVLQVALADKVDYFEVDSPLIDTWQINSNAELSTSASVSDSGILSDTDYYEYWALNNTTTDDFIDNQMSYWKIHLKFKTSNNNEVQPFFALADGAGEYDTNFIELCVTGGYLKTLNETTNVSIPTNTWIEVDIEHIEGASNVSATINIEGTISTVSNVLDNNYTLSSAKGVEWLGLGVTPFEFDITWNGFYVQNAPYSAKYCILTDRHLGADLSSKQDALVSGTNIKTINNTSLLGSGNIDTSEIFIANGTTTYNEISNALLNGKTVFYNSGNIYHQYTYSTATEHQFASLITLYSGDIRVEYATVNTSNTWNIATYTVADTDLSNLSSTGKAVIDGQWVALGQDVIATAVSVNGSTDLPYTVNVPNDGHVYEVMIRADANTTATSGNWFIIGIKTNSTLTGDYAFICGAKTTSNSTVGSMGTVIVPIKYATNNLYLRRNTNYHGSTMLKALAYRRVGTNS